MKTICILVLVAAMSATACWRIRHLPPPMTDIPDSQEWKTFKMPEYGISFRYPPDAIVDDSPGAVGGDAWRIDGLHRSPFSVKLMPEYSPYLVTGVFYHFKVRFVMLTKAAQLDPMWAKKHGWTERPTTALYPFDYKRDQDALRIAIERLYVMTPDPWTEIAPVTIDQKNGLRLRRPAPWDNSKKPKDFEEIIAVPMATDRILLIHAGYSRPQSDSDLQARREVFLRIAASVRSIQQ